MPLTKEELLDFAKKAGIEVDAKAKTKEIEDILLERMKGGTTPSSEGVVTEAMIELAEKIGIEVPKDVSGQLVEEAIVGAFVNIKAAAAANAVPSNPNTPFTPNDAALKVCDPAVKNISISGLSLHAFPEDPLTEFFIFKNENKQEVTLRAGGKAITVKAGETFVVTKSAQNALKGYKASNINYLGRKAQG